MDQYQVVMLMRDTLLVTLLLNTPVLLVSLIVGLFVAVIQTTTQIQEQNLTFVPKVFVVVGVLILTSNWMLTVLTGFTYNLFGMLSRLGK